MNQFTNAPKVKPTRMPWVTHNLKGYPRINGIPTMHSQGPAEFRNAKVGVPANDLAEYISREGGPELGLGHTDSLKRLLAALDDYRYRGRVPADVNSVTLDVANQNVKWMLGQYKNTRIRIGASSAYYDYLVSETLLKVADTLSYYLEPNGDKVMIRFLIGPDNDSQIKLEGHATRPMPGEVKNAICALLGIVRSELLPNGSSYVITMP